MKNRLTILVAVCLLAVGLLSYTSYVDAAADVTNPTIFCQPGLDSATLVTTNNQSGNFIFICKGTGIFGNPAKTTIMKNTGVCDFVAGQPAYRDHVTIHTNGNFLLTCMFRD